MGWVGPGPFHGSGRLPGRILLPLDLTDHPFPVLFITISEYWSSVPLLTSYRIVVGEEYKGVLFFSGLKTSTTRGLNVLR